MLNFLKIAGGFLVGFYSAFMLIVLTLIQHDDELKKQLLQKKDDE